MFTNIPTRQRRAIKVDLVASWLLAGAGGVAAVVVSPLTIVAELGRLIVYGWGSIVAVSALIAVYGIVANRYRFEWVGAWMAALGIVPYVLTVWWLVFGGETTRLTQAFIVAALMGFFVHRALSCAAHAAKLRALHEESNDAAG